MGSQLTCVRGPRPDARKEQGDGWRPPSAQWNIRFVRVDAEARFLGSPASASRSASGKIIIGEEFIRVFEESQEDRPGGLSGAGHHLPPT